jgi:hypothetical protein
MRVGSAIKRNAEDHYVGIVYPVWQMLQLIAKSLMDQFPGGTIWADHNFVEGSKVSPVFAHHSPPCLDRCGR